MMLNLSHLALVVLSLSPSRVFATPSLVKRDVIPYMPYDDATTKYCTYWYDNYMGKTCKEIFSLYLVSTADMVLWNPSLTATCGNWQVQSYCVEANGGPTTPVPTTSTSSSTSTTKSAAPTSTVKPLWTLLGCWLDAAQPTLEFRTNITGGDSVMTVEKCQTACYQTGLLIAGLEATSQCWCSSYIANEATNSTECNLPCAGNSAQICGGQNRLSLYKGKLPVTITSRTTTSTSTTSTSSSVPVATAPVSRDGLCGPSSPKKATCASSAFGNCCSSSGKCGWTSEFCSAGICLTDFGTCSTAQAISTDGKCGSASSTKATCRGSAFGQCCSAKGNCGSGVFFCGKSNQCQPLYGNCIDISTDGKCGVASSTGNATCSGSTFGDCCSVKGNCGDTSFFCASYNNCQPQFGTCFPTSTDGKCGAASPSNATCSSSTSFGGCCSVKGNCGNSDAFCNVKNLCQPKFGVCTPVSTDGKCGSASSVGATCGTSSFGSCCSVKGNCGSTDAFCKTSNACQPNFGTCT